MTQNVQQELLPGSAKRVGRGWRWTGFELDRVQDPAETVTSGSPTTTGADPRRRAACLATLALPYFLMPGPGLLARYSFHGDACRSEILPLNPLA